MRLNLNLVKRIFRETGHNLLRNGWMSIASVTTVAISMFVLAFFVVLTVNINQVTHVLQSQVELKVFIKPKVPRPTEMTLLHEARKWPEVRQIAFFTKADAAKSLQREFPNQRDLLQLIRKSNPLFDGFNVYTQDPGQIPAVAHRFEKLPQVRNVVYQGQVVARLDRLSVILKWVGWIVETFLALATLFIIMNTIRLAVFARRREIQVMKLVGATDWFIRWPFILEGLTLGLLGALVAQTIIFNGYGWMLAAAQQALPFWPLASMETVGIRTAEFTLTGGVVVGALASTVAIRRFLKV